jgi:hypothetical protein
MYLCKNAYISSQFAILKALYGVYAKDVHVRMACLNAVKCIPAVSSRSLPQNTEVATSIWIALHDPEKVCPPFFSRNLHGPFLLFKFFMSPWNKPRPFAKCLI